MLEPIVKTIDVPCNQKHAFTVFVDEINSWWPRERNSVSAMQGEVAKRIVVENREGGKVYEIGHDDTEHHWGSVTCYDPHERLSIDWHIGLPSEKASLVDVRFVPIDATHTRVELTHSRWEALGDDAEKMRSGYDAGWVGVFETAYQSACVEAA